MKIIFYENGLELIDKNNNKTFIAYQSITSITDVSVKIDYSNYDILLQRFFGNEVRKYASFYISTIGKKSYEVFVDDFRRSFPRLNDEKQGFFKIVFNETEGCSKEARDWLKNENDMEEIIKNTKELRQKVINHFNNWSA